MNDQIILENINELFEKWQKNNDNTELSINEFFSWIDNMLDEQ